MVNELALAEVNLDDIDASPFQHRRAFCELKLKELAKSIGRDGLVEPIVVRKLGHRFELIAGERRVRAVKQHLDSNTITARIVKADDLQARRMCAAENLQREDLSAVETVEAIVELLDAELIGSDEKYDGFGKLPLTRVKKLLSKMHSDQCKETNHIDNKFIIRIETVFNGLPKSVGWQSFFTNDLPLITTISQEVRDVAAEHKLNKSQTKALANVAKAVCGKLLEAGGQPFCILWGSIVPKHSFAKLTGPFEQIRWHRLVDSPSVRRMPLAASQQRAA